MQKMSKLPNSLIKLGCLTALTTILMAGAASADPVMAKKGETARIAKACSTYFTVQGSATLLTRV